MDDVKRPPRQNLTNGDDSPSMPAGASGRISQTSDSIAPKVAKRTGNSLSPISDKADLESKPDTKDTKPDMTPKVEEKQPETTASDKPVELEDLDVKPKPVEPTEPSADKDLEESPHIYDPAKKPTNDKPTTVEQSTPELPEPAPDLSPAKPEVESQPPKPMPDMIDGSIQTKAGDIPTSDLPPSPPLNEGKKGKVSKAPTDHPKKRINWPAILVAFVLALSLAGGAGYAYWQSKKDKPPVETNTTVEETPTTDEVSSESLDQLDSDIDKTLKDIKDTDESVNGDLTDTGLGL